MYSVPPDNLWSLDNPPPFFPDANPEADRVENDIFTRSLYGQPFPPALPQDNSPVHSGSVLFMDPLELHVSTSPKADSQPPLKISKTNEDDDGPIDPGSEEQTSAKQLSLIDVLFRIKLKAEALLVEHADAVEESSSAPLAQNLIDRVDELFAQLTQVLNEQKLRKAEPLTPVTSPPQACLSQHNSVDDDFLKLSSCEDKKDSSQKSVNQDEDGDYEPNQSVCSSASTAPSAEKTLPKPVQTLPIPCQKLTVNGQTLHIHTYLKGKRGAVVRSKLDTMINENTINARDAKGNTPLLIAIRHKRKTTLLKYLIARGAITTAQNDEGETCLHAAVASGSAETVKILLNNGADPTVADKMGVKPANLKKTDLTKSAIENIRRLFDQYKPGVKFKESTEISLQKLLRVTPKKSITFVHEST